MGAKLTPFCVLSPLACEQVLFNVTSNVTSMRQSQQIDSSPSACSNISNPGDCNKKPECRHTGQCGCIPSKCDCGETDCISGEANGADGISMEAANYWYPNLTLSGTEETLDVSAGICENTTGEIQMRIRQRPQSRVSLCIRIRPALRPDVAQIRRCFAMQPHPLYLFFASPISPRPTSERETKP
jgi:hypothetical protein